MAEYMFGCGPGHLSRRVASAAQREGATLINHTDPGCGCGCGCGCGRGCRGSCPARKRHWLTVPETGIGRQHAQQVMASLRAAGLVS